tara:strand:- start:2187 stop:3671 length:1485 start_codon:yes stop_codon:yes gene_type:complete
MSIDRSSSDARSRERPRARRRSRRGRGVAVSRNCPADVVDAHRPQTRVDARDRPSARETRGTTVIVSSRAFGRARVDASSVGARERANARAGRFVRDAMRATTTTTTTRAVGTDDALDVFLRDARAAFRADASEVSVSVGNEACDLDSVACAVAHAYAESASAGGIVVPIVSCAREELLLRPDVVSALANAGVSLESLTCAEDVAAATETPKSVCLVDHNALSARLFPESWQARVTRVIDHHEDTGMHADAVDRVIELIGSCSSLVYRDVVRVAGRDDVARRVARLLLGAILLDTRFLDASTTRASEVDFVAAEALREILAWDEDETRKEYETLSRARHDQSSLSCAQLLAKDYKQWTMDGYEIGIASFGVRFQDLIARQDSTSVDAECDAFAAARRVDALFMMSSFEDVDAGGSFARQIAAMTPSPPPPPRGKIVDARAVMTKLGEHTPMTPLDAGDAAPRAFQCAFAQGDVKASRKKIQPLLARVFAEIAST